MLREALGAAHTLLADTGYFSAANVVVCKAPGLVPLLSTRCDQHDRALRDRFAADPPAHSTEDPVERMKHRLTTKTGRVL